jgi:hypothetical protein
MLSTYPTAERPSRLNLTCLSVCVCLALLLGGTVYISVPECGIDGNAQVLRIEACPAIKPGTGHVIIGKFIHHSARVIDLHVSGEPKPIGTTDNHLFWSETQQDFVPAGQLAISETLLTKTGTATVTAIMPRGPPETVYNLEVHGHHVYQVGSQCLLVHNGGVCPTPHTGYGAFGKGRGLVNVDGGYEHYYRAMSVEHYDDFLRTGRIPSTTETFISPTKSFSESYSGVLVKLQTKSGTYDKLMAVGYRAHGTKAASLFPDLSPVKRGWGRRGAQFKPEGTQVNIGLGKGKALDVFNDNIVGFETIQFNQIKKP